MKLLILLNFLFASEGESCIKKELYVKSQELKRLGDIGINGLKLSNLLACEKMVNGKYDKKKDKCTFIAEVCANLKNQGGAE